VDPSPFFYIVIIVYYLLALFTFSQTTIFYHTVHLILCLQQTGEIDNLTVSWGRVLGCVVCRFYVAAGAKLRPRRGAIYKLSGAVTKLASINLRKLVLSHTGSINLGFLLREDLLLCSSYLPLGVPNWAVIYTLSSNFSGAVAGEKENFCKGSLSLPIFYSVIVLLYFIFACIFLSKKNKKISSFCSWYFIAFTFSSLCCSLNILWRTFQ
jgi:hypothetical protein